MRRQITVFTIVCVFYFPMVCFNELLPAIRKLISNIYMHIIFVLAWALAGHLTQKLEKSKVIKQTYQSVPLPEVRRSVSASFVLNSNRKAVDWNQI